MQIGKGYDSIAHEGRGSAVYLDQKVLLASDDTSSLTETQQRSKVKRMPYSPGSYRLRCFESLDELTKLISGSLGLTAKLPQLGLSLDVSASKSERVDANFIYYLLELRSGEYAETLVSVPQLSEFAKKVLEISPPQIYLKELELSAKEAELKKKQADFTAAPAAVTDSEKLQKTAQDALDFAQAENDALTAIFSGIKSNDLSKEQIKVQTESLVKLSKAKQDLSVAKDKLAQAKSNHANFPAVILKLLQDVTTLQGELHALNTAAGNSVDEAKIKEFYKRFGTHFVNKVSYGRQFVALITIDRNSVLLKKDFKMDAGITSDYVAVKGSLKREMSQLATESLVKIDIASDGILASAMPSPQNMKELQAAIIDFTSHAHQTPEPAVIDFELESYANILAAAGVKSESVKYLTDRIEYATNVCDNLHELRASAIRYYATRYFHQLSGGGAQANSLLAGDETKLLERDPHNRRLQYLFEHLSNIILYFNGMIDSIHQDAFQNIPGVIEAVPANNVDANKVEAQLHLIRNELEERAGYKLMHVTFQDLQNTRTFAETKFRATIPAIASRLHISAYSAAAMQLNDPIADDMDVETTAGNLVVRKFKPPAAIFNNTLGWNCNDFALSLYDYLNDKIFTATSQEHSTIVPPQLKREEDLQFSLKQWHAIPNAQPTYQTTVRFFAAVKDGRLNLDVVNQERINILTRALEAKALPDVVGDAANQKKCVMM